MQVSVVNKVHPDRNNENEVEVPRALASLELIVMNKAKDWIVNNEDVLIVKNQSLSQIEETDKLEELPMAFSKNAPKSENDKKVIDMDEFREEWDKMLGERGSTGKNLENPVCDYYLDSNRELEESKTVNNALGERQLEIYNSN